MRVAAIVPVYRRPRLVREALDSIAAQTRPPDRLIVVDDGSDDGTPDAVAGWLRERRLGSGAELLRRAHLGVSAARNAGAARAADCDVLAFLDSDDVWQPRYLERMATALWRAPGAVAATCDKDVVVRAVVRRECKRRYAGAATRELFCAGACGTSNTVVRTSAFRLVGGYDEDLHVAEDQHLLLLLSLQGRYVHVPEPLCVYRWRMGQAAREEPSLGDRFADRRVRRARSLERFLFERGGAGALPRRVWRPRMSARWTRAARQLAALGRLDEARSALRRARALWPLSPLVWLAAARLGRRPPAPQEHF